MARYVLNASGQYVNPETGSSLYNQYKAPLASTGGTGDFYDASGQALYSPNAPSPAVVRGRPQPSLRDRVFDAAQEAQGRYDAAVQSQMDQVLAGYAERRDAGKKSLEKLGNTDVADINARWDARIAEARSRNNASGMGNTTKAAADIAIFEGGRQRELARARGDRAAMEIDTMSALEGDRIRAIENMNIAPPDMSALLELARMEGEATQQGIEPAAWGGGGGGGAPTMGGLGGFYGGAAQGGYFIPGVGGGGGVQRAPRRGAYAPGSPEYLALMQLKRGQNAAGGVIGSAARAATRAVGAGASAISRAPVAIGGAAADAVRAIGGFLQPAPFAGGVNDAMFGLVAPLLGKGRG